MKKQVLCIVYFLAGTCVLHAQTGLIKRGAQVLSGKTIQVEAEAAARKAAAGSKMATQFPAAAASSVPGTSAAQTAAPSLPLSDPRAKHSIGVSPEANLDFLDGPVAAPNKPSKESISEKYKRIRKLEKEQAALNEQSNELAFSTDLGKSVLFAPVEAEGKTGGFTVTAVKTNYQGKEEIFGVIASHVLAESYYTFNSSLKRSFHVHLKQADGSTRVLPAEVVQISPRSMLDISLVKFSPQAQALVKPLEIAPDFAEENEVLLSLGFKAGKPQEPITRTVHKRSFVSVRTDQNLEGERQGFCGSPLLDATEKVKAIHTGTKENKGDIPDVSYGTHAQFINLLVEGYHNNGQAFYDFLIHNKPIARLNVDEYISAVYLYDATGKRIFQTNIEDKFAQSWFERTLQEYPQAAYVQLTSRKAHWETDRDGDSILKEDRSRSDKTKRQHWYNLQTQQIEPSRPFVIKR